MILGHDTKSAVNSLMQGGLVMGAGAFYIPLALPFIAAGALLFLAYTLGEISLSDSLLATAVLRIA